MANATAAHYDAPHGAGHDAHADAHHAAPESFLRHLFESDGYSLNGKLLENTYGEWRASRHGSQIPVSFSRLRLSSSIFGSKSS